MSKILKDSWCPVIKDKCHGIECWAYSQVSHPILDTMVKVLNKDIGTKVKEGYNTNGRVNNNVTWMVKMEQTDEAYCSIIDRESCCSYPG